MSSKSLKLITVLIASEADIAVSDFRGWGISGRTCLGPVTSVRDPNCSLTRGLVVKLSVLCLPCSLVSLI